MSTATAEKTIGSLSDAERAELLQGTDGDNPVDAGLDDEDGEPAEVVTEGEPAWFVAPDKWAPPVGYQVHYVLFKAKNTATPAKGDRHCAFWILTEAEENMAIKRSRGEGARIMAEMAKAMVRSIDGHKADMTASGKPGDVNRFWNEIGPKYRQMMKALYSKTHALDAEEIADFFINCIAVRTSAG